MTAETEAEAALTQAGPRPDTPRLIERAFPLRQASLDSLHEKNIRHGHISTLHIWPARRPLAACRAVLISTLLPDPGTAEKRREILERLAGKIVQEPRKRKLPNGKVKVEYRDETVGGILHWGRESGPDLDWFRGEIRKAYGGRAPRVLDPFAGGGAIPLEAMRLGCEVAAADINPVAWFILKCTLEYPQSLAGQSMPLPGFVLKSPEFMRDYWNSKGKHSTKQLDAKLAQSQTLLAEPLEADLAWHVRAWGWWVFQRAKVALEKYYPTLDQKPTIAYLWARTVTCKNCRAIIPLMKTRWLCKKDSKRVLVTMEPKKDGTGVVFGMNADVPVGIGNAAQRREHDKRIGNGTVTRSGAWCPCCGSANSVAMTSGDIREEAIAGRMGAMPTAVVVEGTKGQEFRLPTQDEKEAVRRAEKDLAALVARLPLGLPEEPTPRGGGRGAARAFAVRGYGLNRWIDLFTTRQLLSAAEFLNCDEALWEAPAWKAYPPQWQNAIAGFLAISFDKLIDRQSALCRWDIGYTKISNTFTGFRLPVLVDFCEGSPISNSTGSYLACVEWVAKVAAHTMTASREAPAPQVLLGSAISLSRGQTVDVIVTDPPYYDAIPYSDLMDFFYVWLRRGVGRLPATVRKAFSEPLAPKWDSVNHDGELIDDETRHGGSVAISKAEYENGMYRAFLNCHRWLTPSGRLVVVFAHKEPDAWETLVAAIIRAGFLVDGSWPIQTEMGNRTRAISSAALSSSIWLVCRKRAESARPGWDNQVLSEMRSRIHERLREFWDAGIRGPDFVWAAAGPALEAYSQYPLVKKANEPGALMTVSEFLRHVRRIVVDFVVGRVLSKNGGGASISGLDDLTTYYLLHRHDFGFDDAPAGACILYAVSCGLSDKALADEHDLLIRTGGIDRNEDEEDDEALADQDNDAEVAEGSGTSVRLKAWNQRKVKGMGDDVSGKPAPLIDQIHRLMQLWRAGDEAQVNGYLEEHTLGRSPTFHQVLQALIELAKAGTEERRLLESISNHVAARGGTVKKPKGIHEYGESPG